MGLALGLLELSSLPSLNASLALYYWAVATMNFCFAKAAVALGDRDRSKPR